MEEKYSDTVISEDRELFSNNIKLNCGTCCHKEVCAYKEKYEDAVKRGIKEFKADFPLVEVKMKCHHHMYLGGTTFEMRDD